MKLRTAIALCLLLFLVGSCGDGSSVSLHDTELAPAGQAAPLAFPSDGFQPWESLDPDGYVAVAQRAASSIKPGSEFQPGVERFSDGNATEQGEALRLDAGAGAMEWAVFRFPLAGQQPGALSVDCNLLGAQSSYFIGLTDFAGSVWRWHGPFSEAQIILEAGAGNFTSALGNCFVAVVAYNGSAVDIVGVGIEPDNPADSTAPEAPQGLVVNPRAGALELRWLSVDAADLAGYRVYYSSQPFSAPSDSGVQSLAYLEGTTRLLLPAVQHSYVAISAVDSSGNESALSEVLDAEPLGGTPPSLLVTTSVTSAMLNEPIELQVSGADSYDVDLDGDGDFELTGTTGSNQFIDTAQAGLIRPRVRGTGSGGDAVALGSVSLLVTANSRPAANAQVSPQMGIAPLNCTFNGTGADFDGTIAEYAWDFDGDGIYDHNSSVDGLTAEQYPAPGFFNAKLRVTDDQGAWDVDTVAVQVTKNPAIQEPDITAVGVSPNPAATGDTVTFSVVAFDYDGSIAGYSWDLDGDGSADSTDLIPQLTTTAAGDFTATVTVTDNNGHTSSKSVNYSVEDSPANVPPYLDELYITSTDGYAPLQTSLYLSSSDSDGIASREWDFDNDGDFEPTDNSSSQSWTYPAGYHTVRVRVSDNLGAFSEIFGGVVVYPNEMPVADVTADSQLLYKPLLRNSWRTYLRSYGSYDPDGGMLSYEYDHDGDGSFQISSFGDTGDDYTRVSYAATGVFQARARVTDDENKTVTSSPVDVRVFSLALESFPSSDDIGERSQVVDWKGRALVAWLNKTTNRLQWSRATDSEGHSWTEPLTLEPTNVSGAFGLYASTLNNWAGIAYYDSSVGDLKWVYWSPQDTADGAVVTIDSTANDTGQAISVINMGNVPCVAYYDATNDSVKFSRGGSESGNSWPSLITVYDTGNDVGSHLSLQEVNGNPAVAFYNATNGNLYYRRADNSNGSSWTGSIITIDDSASDVGKYCSMALNYLGRPIVAYFNDSDNKVNYRYSSGTDGGSWAALREGGGTGGPMFLLPVDRGIMIAHYTGSSFAVNHEEDYLGLDLDFTYNQSVEDPYGNRGNNPAGAVVGGRPFITYYDGTNGDLRVAIGRY